MIAQRALAARTALERAALLPQAAGALSDLIAAATARTS